MPGDNKGTMPFGISKKERLPNFSSSDSLFYVNGGKYSSYNAARIASATALNSSSVSFSFGLEKSMSFSFCIGIRWI